MLFVAQQVKRQVKPSSRTTCFNKIFIFSHAMNNSYRMLKKASIQQVCKKSNSKMPELEIFKFGKGSNIRGYVDESKRFGLYIVMIHMAKELYLSERPLGIDPIVKCIPNLLDCNLFFCLRVCCTAAIRKYQPPLLKLSKNQNTIKQIHQEISQILST